MKRVFPFLLTVLVVLALAGSSPSAQFIATSQAVQIPLELKLAINGALLFVVMLGLQWVFDQFGLDLRGIGAALAGAVSEFAILQFQGLIDIIPAQYDLLVVVGLNVLLAILTGLGFFRAFFQRERASVLFK